METEKLGVFLLKFLFLILLNWLLLPLANGKSIAGNDLFTNGPIIHLSVFVKEPELDALRGDPRKFVHGTLKEADTKYEKIAIHLKGAAGSFRDLDDRPALTLDFNKFIKKQKFHGLSKIHLNNSVQDPVMLDEALCGELFREVGVPAARTAHARVKLNEKNLGIYVVKEGFTKEFVQQYFQNDEGNLYDAGFVKEITDDLPKVYGKGPDDHSDLKRMIRAAHEPDEANRWKRLNEIVDIERFISMSVLEVFTVRWDGYGMMKNNYKLYHNAKEGKFVFFVHGMDQMFGRGGNIHQPLDPPMTGLISQALFSTEAGRKQYSVRLKEIFEKSFQLESLLKRVERLAEPIRSELKSNPDELQAFDGELAGLKDRIKTRQEFVAGQIRQLRTPAK